MDDGQAIASGEVGRAEPHRDPRTKMFIAALLEWDAGSTPVTVRNLSEHGALVEGAGLPPTGAAVRLVRGTLSAAGVVAWASARRCGLRVSELIAVAPWMAKPVNVAQAEIDAAVRRIKAGQLMPPGAALAPLPAGEPDLAASIRALEAQLATVSDELASTPETIARHPEQLQTLDLLPQGLARLRGRVGG